MVRNSITRLAATLFALALVSSFVTAPVAAMPGDDGIDVGGDDGISVGTDGVSIGGDDGVTVGTDGVEVANRSMGGDESPVSADDDGVSVGGDDGVSAGADGVSVADEEISLGNDSDLPVDDLPVDDLPVDDLPVDDLPVDDLSGDDEAPIPDDGSLPRDDLPDAGSVGSVVDTQNGSVDTGAVPVLETLAPVLERAPTNELSREFDEEDLPAGSEDVLGPVPFESVPADPQDLPIGSESAVDCTFPVRGDDLPLEAVPGPSQLPVQPNLPGVPTSLLTPEAVGSIALGIPPEPCKAYDPDDPSVDPTAPPTNVDFDRRNFASEASGDRVVWVDEYNLETEDGQDGQLFWSFLLSEDKVVATEDLTVSDGQTDDYVGLESSYVGNRDLSDTEASVEVMLLGSGIGANLDCADPVSEKSVDPERLQNGELECGATPEGLLQPPLGPEEIADTVQDPPISDEPPIDIGEIPIPISDIINL